MDRAARIAAGSGAVVSGTVTMAVYTDFLTLDAASRTLQGTDVLLGAQDLAAADRGACTGEVSGADLAALGVFGQRFLEEVYVGYNEVSALADGWQERVALYQLHMLMIHVYLFGGGYGAHAAALARRYV